MNATNIQNNITITPLHKGIIINGSEWIISHDPVIGFDLKIHMEWGLGANNDARVSIFIKSNANNRNTESLIMAISGNNTEFLSMIIALNNTHNNKIYPDCSGNTASGHIQSIANNTTYPTRIGRITDGGNLSTLSNMNEPQLNNGRTNIWPISMTLDNYPDCRDNGIDYNSCGNDLVLDFTSIDSGIQHCSFGNALPSNAGLDIFIGVANPGETLSITEIQLIYQYKGTFAPSMQPTATPTSTLTTIATSNTLGFRENVTIEIEVETDLELATNSTVIRVVVEDIANQLIAKLNSSIIGTEIIAVRGIDDGYLIVVVIEVGSDREVDLDEDVINNIDITFEREHVVITDITIVHKEKDVEEEIMQCSVIIWIILGVIGILGVFGMVIARYSDKWNCRTFDIFYFVISVMNLLTDVVVAFCIMNYAFYVAIIVGLFVVIPYIVNIVYWQRNRTKKGGILITMICILISGDTFISLRLTHHISLSRIKWITIAFQYVPQILIQSIFMVIIIQNVELLIVLSICLSFICCVSNVKCGLVKNKDTKSKEVTVNEGAMQDGITYNSPIGDVNYHAPITDINFLQKRSANIGVNNIAFQESIEDGDYEDMYEGGKEEITMCRQTTAGSEGNHETPKQDAL